MSEKKRLDVLLYERGLAQSREKARALIMAGDVLVDDERCDKAGASVAGDAVIRLKAGTQMKYVSRGGLKLEKAMHLYGLKLDGCICMDIGASTGGFTDCMLQNGAQKVYAVDVGYGQLAWPLRNDARVVNMERTNIRYVTCEQIPEKLDFASVDVSFISLTLVLPVLYGLMKPGGTALLLVKPQFEAGKGKVGKKGVVRDLTVHIEVCRKIYDFLETLPMRLLGATFSPIKGPQGNIEYLFYISKEREPSIPFESVEEMVCRSHAELNDEGR